MRLLPALVVLLLAGCAATTGNRPDAGSIGPAISAAAPPASPRGDAASELHGVRVEDPWRWLEDGEDPAVRKWIAAQNAWTDTVVGAMPGGEALAKRVRELAITSTTRAAPSLAGGTLFYLQHTPPQPQPVLMARPWPDGEAQVLVDPNDAAGGGVAISGYWPSPDGDYVAWGSAEGGSELTTLHVLELATGTVLADALPYAGGGTTPQAVAWDADGEGFVYVRFPPPQAGAEVEQFHAALVHHELRADATEDAVVFGKDYSEIAEYKLMLSPETATLAVLAKTGDGGPWEVWLRRDGDYQRILGEDANVRGARWVGERLLVESFAGAPRGKVLAVDPADGSVRELLAQGKGALQSLAPIGDGFLVVRSSGPDWWVEHHDADGKLVRRLPLPEHGIAIGGIAAEYGQPQALVSWSGWTTPTKWTVYDGRDGSLETVFAVEPAADYRKVAVHRVFGMSPDGTRIPVTLLAMDGVSPNGQRPTILYGYGGFGIPVRPSFLGPRRAWLERGGVYAVANIRGGSEFGEAWHEAGMRLAKQNVFDDFFAAAEALKRSGWTDSEHLGIMGGSNGGLLMGAELVQHPEAFRAVVAAVGIFDMPRHETEFANGRYNVPEYGSIADAEQFRATLAYSPLQNVEQGAAYPAVLMTTGVNDPRVAPWQSRKFTAALQTASTSGHPVLLLTRMHAGHGVGASFAQRVGNTAISLTFFAHELGLGDSGDASGVRP